MFRTIGDQPSLWESLLPDELLVLPVELARVDALLDDPVFFVPFQEFFDPSIGRPSIPMETCLRMMFLKFRYRLGFESLCREVSDSITWRRFCRIPLDVRVPHPTTLMKLTKRCGPAVVAACNDALLAEASDAKLLRTDRVRVDTTVIPADVAYPRDSGLLAKAVKRILTTGRRIQAAGGATRTKTRDRSRAAGTRAHGIAARLRLRTAAGEQAQATVKRITGELAGLAEKAADDADKLLVNARRSLARAQVKAKRLAEVGVRDAAAGRRRGRLVRAVNDLTGLLEATRKIAAQTRQRLAGTTPDGASRRVSLHDPDARPIAKGQLGKPVQFGYKAQVMDNVDGVVLDHTLEQGNPADAHTIGARGKAGHRTDREEAPHRHRGPRLRGESRGRRPTRTRRPQCCHSPQGKPGKARQAEQHRPAFRRTVKWRTGCEGRISSLKRGYGWDRTRLDGVQGAQTWTGYGVLAHNLVKIGALAS